MDNAAYVGDNADCQESEVTRSTDTVRHRKKEPQQTATTVQLPRTIGVVSGSAILISAMVGAGIFITPAGVLRHSGSVGASLLTWLACGIVELVGALCYIELGLLFPEHGGEFIYLLRAFGPLHPFLGPLPAFLQGWIDVNAYHPAGTAVLAMTFVRYCVRPWYGEYCDPPGGLEPLLGVFFVITLATVNCFDVRWSARLQKVSTAAKLATMAIIVAAGVYSLSRGNTEHLATGFEGTTTSAGDMVAAFLTCLWAFGGVKNLNNITEEVKNPSRTLPLAILSSLPVVTLAYVLVNVAYLAVLSPQEIIDAPAVGFSFGERALGPASFLMPLGAALSVCGTLHGSMLSSSRFMLAVARRGHHIHAFSMVHVRWLTPVPALIFQALVASVMVLIGNVDELLRLGSFVNALLNALVLAALLVLRKTMPNAQRPYRVPLLLAWLRLAFCCYLVVAPIIDEPRVEYLYALGMLGLGLAVYTPCVFFGWSPPLLARCTVGFQRALELLPSEY